MQVKVKVFIREQGENLIVMLGVFLCLDTVVFIKLPKTKMGKYLLNDMGCLHVFNLVLFYVYTYTYICVYLLYTNSFKHRAGTVC